MSKNSQLKFEYPIIIQGIGQRDNQEDNYFSIENSEFQKIFMVCDGMGGLQRGEIASKIVCDTIASHILNSVEIKKEIINKAIELSAISLQKYSEKQPDLQRMGTTLSALFWGCDKLWVAHIGDSRVYQFRNGNIIFKTKDHSLVQLLIDSGDLSENDAFNHPKKNIILKSINNFEKPLPNIEEITDLKNGDYFLICTDGILESWNDQMLSQLFSKNDNTQFIAQKMSQLCASSSKDNHTAYILKVSKIQTKSKWWKSIFKNIYSHVIRK